VYFPLAEQTLRVDARPLRGPLRAWWYDSRTGRAHPAGGHAAGILTFISPLAGPDWILVLDTAEKEYSAPGQAA